MEFHRIHNVRSWRRSNVLTNCRTRALFLLLSVSAIGLWCRPSEAQVDISASLVGTVTDQNGAVILGAAVVANNRETGVTSRTASNETGSYQFLSLEAGNYTVTCTMQG